MPDSTGGRAALARRRRAGRGGVRRHRDRVARVARRRPTLRQRAVDLQVAADDHHFTYTWEWAGVPIIRLPDDIMVLQELFWGYRPQRVVETGVARGGSMVLDASLMR